MDIKSLLLKCEELLNGKKRIDLLLVEQGFFDSREKAKRAIMAGIVHNDHEIIDKPGTKSSS